MGSCLYLIKPSGYALGFIIYHIKYERVYVSYKFVWETDKLVLQVVRAVIKKAPEDEQIENTCFKIRHCILKILRAKY